MQVQVAEERPAVGGVGRLVGVSDVTDGDVRVLSRRSVRGQRVETTGASYRRATQ